MRDRGSQLHRLLPWLRPYRLHIAAALVCAVLAAAFAILVPIVTSRVIIDDILLGRPGFNYGQRDLIERLDAVLGLPVLAGAMLADATWVLLAALLSWAFTFLWARVSFCGLHNLRCALFAHVIRLPASFYDHVKTGEVLTRITNDIESLSEFLTGFGSIAGDVLPFIVAVGVMLGTDVSMTLEVLTLLPLIAGINYIFRKRRLILFQAIRNNLARVNDHLHEHLSGMEIVQLAGRQQRNVAEFDAIASEARDLEASSIRLETRFLPLFETVPYLALGYILLFGGLHVLNNHASIGTIVLFVQFSDMLFRPVINLGDQYNALSRAAPACERLFGLLDRQEALSVPPSPARLPDRLRGEIIFRGLTFGYGDGAAILKNVDLVIEPGQSVAIVGPTGAGKTTLIRLIGRFYDLDEGMLFVDGIDIMQVVPEDIRRRVGVILQDFHIFPGTVLENITLGNVAVTTEKAIEAARLVHALPFIETLPRGFHTLLEAGGGNLSHGQRQLLAFARVIALDPEILILDEATASIDTETERVIQSALHELQAGRTTIIIAHRLQTIRDASNIVVLDQGCVVETGTHDALIARNGLYRTLHKIQSRGEGLLGPAS